MKKELNRYVAKQIILAQVASDAGKGIYLLGQELKQTIPIYKVYEKKGYYAKDTCIKKALKTIQSKKNSGFFYHVKVAYPCNHNRHCFLIYFNFQIENMRFQVSFHSFSNMWRYVNQKCNTRWQKKINSRTACFILNDVVLQGKDLKTVIKKRGLI